MNITDDLRDALGDLVRAQVEHSEATQEFLSAHWATPDVTDAKAKALEKAYTAVAAAGGEVARIAMQMGIKPTPDESAIPCGTMSELDRIMGW